MRVKQLKISSFRGIENLILDFPPDEPTVFIGNNGVGKSSILDSLAILLSWLIARIEFDPQSRVSIVDRKNFRFGGIREGELANGRSFKATDIKKGENKVLQILNFLFDSQEIGWYITASEIDNNTHTTCELGILEQLTQNLRNQWQTDPKANLPLAVYYPINRAVFEISLEIPDNYSPKQIDAYQKALDGAQITFESFFQWFRILEDLENEERRDRPNYLNHQLEAVRQAIYSLIPEFSNLRVRRSPLRMTVTKQGQEFTVNQLSDGEKCLLAMVGDLARRLAIANPGLSNPLEGEGVVLIDEIELHLHPKWQREIIPALTRTFPNCQFIVTTHSPQVVSHVKPEGIFILEATSEGIIAKKPESSFGRDSNQILEDIMGVPDRPQQIKNSLRQLFQLIDAGNLEAAKELRHQISEEIGSDEPEFVRADVLMRRKEILNR
ncbi:AAA family ATPase [Aerosakkonemataceae cyanobacterium BLCC-F50]|uniref:AAA family ATPase n=1 Tax=Floridaenema flaviceps BLCC-F50 TaxID=3153642 RepID=A0ABV4XMV4_9CYAN